MANITTENKVTLITVNLWRLVKNCSHTYWADYAVMKLRKEIQRQFGTKQEVKLDMDLNKAIWSRGRKHLPTRLRIEVSRRPSLKDNTKTELFLKHVIVPSFKGLQAESIQLQDE
ncbi:large subunit ribosomal protein L31e [Nematocida homosporus]|uniref:large subunit ribosomal protein L31e n=1 Tax=Nematocida homosporus TaxID=1912981 RepID=UPI00221EB01D|nr:large subunit ribosomal protein L31e [Nematocida homosporus]KAI5187892.1 large subunit ribosomal protein L31e [Nematocida homosporus]